MPPRSSRSSGRSKSPAPRPPATRFAPYSFPPPAAPFQFLNDLIHDYAPLNTIYYVFHWSTFLILGALVGVPFLIFLYLPYSLLKSIFSPLKKALSSPPPEPTDDHATLAVLISGCDTGFGRDLAERLLTSVPPPTTKHKSRS